MARAKLPTSIPLTFFVLRWLPENETYVLHVDDAKRTSYDMGGDALRLSRQLTAWGVPKMLADRAVDAAREFRAAQAVIRSNRVINLFPRGKTGDVVGQMFQQLDTQDQNTFTYL